METVLELFFYLARDFSIIYWFLSLGVPVYLFMFYIVQDGLCSLLNQEPSSNLRNHHLFIMKP